MELNPGNYLPSHDSYSGHGQAAMHASFRRERERGGGERNAVSLLSISATHQKKPKKKNKKKPRRHLLRVFVVGARRPGVACCLPRNLCCWM